MKFKIQPFSEIIVLPWFHILTNVLLEEEKLLNQLINNGFHKHSFPQFNKEELKYLYYHIFQIIKARKLSSAASAANAAMNHITTWVNGSNGIYYIKAQDNGLQWLYYLMEVMEFLRILFSHSPQSLRMVNTELLRINPSINSIKDYLIKLLKNYLMRDQLLNISLSEIIIKI